MKNIFVKLLHLGIVVLGLSQSWDLRAALNNGAELNRPLKLYVKPQESSHKYEIEYPMGEKFFILGFSGAKRWFKVLHPSGVAGWLPEWSINFFELNEEQLARLNLYLERGMRETFRWAINGGGVWATDPFGFGAGGELFINLRRKGLMAKKYDQLEVGSGFYTHFKTESVYQIPVTVQWLFKVANKGNFLIGPFGGFAVVKDPRFRFDHALPVRFGLSVRNYFYEDFGYFINAGYLWRSKKNPFVAVGLSLRI